MAYIVQYPIKHYIPMKFYPTDQNQQVVMRKLLDRKDRQEIVA